MIHNRKNTSNIVLSWRSYLSGNKKSMLNESIGEKVSHTPREVNEYYKAIFSNLFELGLDVDDVSRKFMELVEAKLSDDQLYKMAYGEESEELINNFLSNNGLSRIDSESFIEREPLESDQDLGM
tara:strand:+ start:216 stop:590 length:375 start_codon:yes stop_codon:yes gene_type:complete